MPSKSHTQPKSTYIIPRDTRCSIKCVKNWSNYNQQPPIGTYCVCTIQK